MRFPTSWYASIPAGIILDYKLSDKQEIFNEAEQIIGAEIQALLPEGVAEQVLAHMEEALRTGESQQAESEVEIRAEIRDYETRLVRSGPEEVLVIIRDVTERKRTEKELIKRNFELDSFVYRASHDLKAPLNSLMGLIGLVEGETTDDMVLRYLTMMNKSVTKLDTFIRDLADFSRNARLELEVSPIDWQKAVDESLENLRFMENSDRVEKIVEIKGNGEFHSDPVRISIVLNNLISNSIKYQNLKREDAKVHIEIETAPVGGTIRISDNGIGIAKEHQQKVFNLFFRASIQSYGSGLGMYIVKNAVEKLKGRINVESVEGEGTTFTITLPNHKDLNN